MFHACSSEEIAASEAHTDDAVIIDAVADGKPHAFRHLVSRHKRAVYRYLLLQTRNTHLADDLAQEVFLRAFRAATAGNFAGRASVKTWLFTIAGNCLRDAWRKVKRSRELVDSGVVECQIHALDTSQHSPDEALAHKERREQILLALNDLPADQQRAVHLKFFCELTAGEISEITGAPHSTVKARLRYGLTKLTQKLSSLRGDL